MDHWVGLAGRWRNTPPVAQAAEQIGARSLDNLWSRRNPLGGPRHTPQLALVPVFQELRQSSTLS